jgi:hypothetical protein
MIVAPQTPELGIRDIKRVEFGINPQYVACQGPGRRAFFDTAAIPNLAAGGTRPLRIPVH